MDGKNFLIVAVALLLGIIIGFGFGCSTDRVLDEKTESSESVAENKQFVIGGQVTEVRENSLVMETFDPGHPLEELPTIREIIITPRTQIVEQIRKDPAVYEKEAREYQKLERELYDQMEAGIEVSEWPASPEPIIQTFFTLDEIEVGSWVLVVADANRDVKTAQRFTAEAIKIEAVF
jgi:hypothetical protein